MDRKCWRALDGVSCTRCIDANIECVRSKKRARKKAGTVVDDDKGVLMDDGEASASMDAGLALHALQSALDSAGQEGSEHNTEPAADEQLNGGPHVPEQHTLPTNVERASTPTPWQEHALRGWAHIAKATAGLHRLNLKMEKSHADHLRLKAMYERIEASAARSMEPDPMAEKRQAMCEFLGVPVPSRPRSALEWNTEDVTSGAEDVSEMKGTE